MDYFALATDYDGTLAAGGTVTAATLGALRRFRASGRRLILVTGREMRDLESVFPEIGVFDRVVAENGAVLFTPGTGKTRLLAAAPPEEFVEALRRRGVKPLSRGEVIVATTASNRRAIVETIGEQRLELAVILNKGSAMVLPSGVNKKTGLEAALEELQIAPAQVAGVGDAENDHAFLSDCGWSVAVANALPSVRKTADFVTRGSFGAGVQEMIGMILAENFARR